MTDRSKLRTLDEIAAELGKQSGKPVRPYSTRDFGREQYAEGRSVLVSEEAAERLVSSLRPLIGEGFVVFVGCTRSLDDPPAKGAEVVVAPGADQFAILEIAASDAVNFDMDTADLIRRLRQYDDDFGIDIFHAETDTIEFRFRRRPADMAAFCRDLYEFCPDIVDQGTGTVEALQSEIEEHDRVFLWWD